MTKTPVYTIDPEAVRLWIRTDQLPEMIHLGHGEYISRDTYIEALIKFGEKLEAMPK